MTSTYIDLNEFQTRPVECIPLNPITNLDNNFAEVDKLLNELMNALNIKSVKTHFHQYALALVYGLYYKRNRLDIDWELLCQHFSFRGDSMELSDKDFSHLQYLLATIRCIGDGFSSTFMNHYSKGVYDDWLKNGGWEKVFKIFTISLPIMVISIKDNRRDGWTELFEDGREHILKMMDIFDEAIRHNIKIFNVFKQ